MLYLFDEIEANLSKEANVVLRNPLREPTEIGSLVNSNQTSKAWALFILVGAIYCNSIGPYIFHSVVFVVHISP